MGGCTCVTEGAKGATQGKHRAMTAPAAPADVKDDLLLQIRRLLDKSKPELLKEWKEVDCSDFEPVAKADLLAALLHRLLRGASDLDSAQSQPSSSTSPVASPTNTLTPAKSFKEAVASPARSSDCNNFDNGNAPYGLKLPRGNYAHNNVSSEPVPIFLDTGRPGYVR